MPKNFNLLMGVLIAVAVSRLFPMAFMPLFDTTEARYGDIARIMSETGDWITPWFNYDIPFWGKPPLSFWAQAFSFRLFGVTEFAARVPSWLANLGMVTLIYHAAYYFVGRQQAPVAALVFSTMALSFVLSGAVLTDPFLALGTTLSLLSFMLAQRQRTSTWRWWFFIGLSIGLLAKGPLALVLTFGPIFLWALLRRQWHTLFELPWGRGLLLTAILTLPWYIAAELKTSGFIQYFIVGEHFLRFIDPGWNGDLYGSAHKQPYGTIWLHLILASFPWGSVLLVMLIWKKYSSRLKGSAKTTLNDEQCLLLLATLFPSLFFSFSGNILWTYQLPALSPMAILFASQLVDVKLTTKFKRYGMTIATAVVPLVVVFITVYAHSNPEKLKTQRALVAYFDAHKSSSTQALIYVGEPPFSARFYARGNITQMTLSEAQSLIKSTADSRYFLAVPNQKVDKLLASFTGTALAVSKNKRFTLLRIVPARASSIDLKTAEYYSAL